jgi:hypothetical protein
VNYVTFRGRTRADSGRSGAIGAGMAKSLGGGDAQHQAGGSGSAASEIPPRGAPPPQRGRARTPRRVVDAWRGGTAPTIDQKRLAVAQLRKAFGRIDADFSEAYEHCRNDAQRRALELAHRKAKQANVRTLQEHLLEDRDGWKHAQDEFRSDKAKAERNLARLASAGAVARILKRLTAVEAQLAVLAA